MKLLLSLSSAIKTSVLCILFLLCNNTLKADIPPFTVLSSIFDQTETDSLGLTTAEGTETITIFAPVVTTNKFSNGAVMVAFKDTLYCMWQSSAQDEDAADTWVAYSKSTDGINWSTPMVLAESIADGYCSSGGWWVNGDTLVGYINVWPNDLTDRGGYTSYVSSTDGSNWSEMQPVLMANGDTLMGIFEQDPHALSDGRIINAAHFQPGLLLSPIYTDDTSGVRGWVKASMTNLPYYSAITREIEPSWYLRDDDTLVMVFRDQNSTYYKLASVSGDRGETWTTPVLTNMPDSRSKQSAGNIADSTCYFVSNPVNNKTRIPLVITLSKDGQLFNTAYVLRKGGDGLQPLRFTGQSKKLGYHYPKSMIYKDTLYVSYSTNKEDVEYTRVPLASLVLDTITVGIDASHVFSEGNNITIQVNTNRTIKITQKDYWGDGMVNIFNIQGQLLYRTHMTGSELLYDMEQYASGIYIIDVRTDKERKTRLLNIR